ncbi:hypothetical protein CPB86DRAFT_716798 [Serendipita vermifera]|nr:hypothetical protein CPB86DRAFT_716798 [Serendipita vermifera]
MADLDLELELLALDDGIQIFGEHELKTSPLVSKDALDLSIASQADSEQESEQFVQRGLLGKILSIHSEDLQHTPKDVRLYMNLDAPSSGLVCGVQGSGKSHTVSCILESSLMVDRRIGTLPAPLSTIVFHYDEENGGRSCEAAYLSELKDNQGQGVKEVVVLVSPSNLNTRKKVYSNLKYVKVEALHISEKDLNASRMLCMMGADNLEQVPLYLHTALSILRDMGSDNFSYRAFRKRLDEEEFNKSQMAMLQLRLDLLDSFLKGDGEDITYFFKPGRLVIIDLSDPFVNSTTAAMLFDICLGLFIEWKVSTGKLIVLDEAHKYLTNADANQFTKKICSIIRQQRHLAARVIVSTQEPTVVPSSVLDLLAWIVCHRFSSPSWVKHLMHHMCVEEEEGNSSSKGRGDKGSDWSKRVMALRTGEALLCSPASLFVSDSGQLATLSTGYAVIKTRPRLTRDGGASLLATVDLTEAQYKSGIFTPESQKLSLTESTSPTPTSSEHSASISHFGQSNLNGSDISGNFIDTGFRPTDMLSPVISTIPLQQTLATSQVCSHRHHNGDFILTLSPLNSRYDKLIPLYRCISPQNLTK